LSPKSKDPTKVAYFYGLGASYALTKDVSVKAEYTTQKAKLRAGLGEHEDSRLNLLKVGVAYHF